jgi:hypothetical protein
LETSRQRLTKVVAIWMPPLACFPALQASAAYTRTAPAEPSIICVVFETCLYNRPPPHNSLA